MSLVKRQGFLFGGWLNEGYTSELYLVTMSRDTVNSITISPCITSGTTPKPRAGHAACVVHEKTMAIFGGTSGADHLNDLHFLDSEVSCVVSLFSLW